jgi:hypothetical protein
MLDWQGWKCKAGRYLFFCYFMFTGNDKDSVFKPDFSLLVFVTVQVFCCAAGYCKKGKANM